MPVALGYIDYKNKKMGIGQHFIPSGDIQKDIDRIKIFYEPITGKHPEKQSDIKIKT